MLQQFILNGLIAGTVYAFIALSFVVIYSIARFFHFAHGAVCAWGAYSCYAVHVSLGWPLWLAIPLAVTVAGVLGLGMEMGVYRPLRGRGARPLVLLLASLGLYLMLENLIAILFGNETRILRAGGAASAIGVLGARLTTVQITTAAVCGLAFLATWATLHFTAVGRLYRATSDDPELARIMGVRSETVVAISFLAGSVVASIATILVALDVDMRPTMGLTLLLPGVVAMIVGGTGSIPGALVGGLALGLVQHLGVWAIGARWQDAITFLVLVLCLAFRPRGFLGGPTTRPIV